MLYGQETFTMTKGEEAVRGIEVAEVKMVRFLLGVTRSAH